MVLCNIPSNLFLPMPIREASLGQCLRLDPHSPHPFMADYLVRDRLAQRRTSVNAR